MVVEEEYSFKDEYKKGDIIYYLRVMVNLGVNEVVESTVRTIEDDYMVASNGTTNQAIYISKSAKNLVFKDKKQAVKESKKFHVRKVTKDTSEESE